MSISAVQINQLVVEAPPSVPNDSPAPQPKVSDDSGGGDGLEAKANLASQGDLVKNRLNNMLAPNLSAGERIALTDPTVDPGESFLDKPDRHIRNYSQSDPQWADQKYEFANLGKGTHTIGSDGCTITALTNVLGVAVRKGWTAPTVADTNKRNNNFFSAFDNANFKDLTGNNRQLKRRFNVTNSIEGLNPSGGKLTPIGVVALKRDAQGQPIKDQRFGGNQLTAKYVQPEPQLLKDVKAAVKSGTPVLLGLSRNADKSTWVKTGDSRDGWVRHTIAAVDVDKKTGELIVLDSADGKRKTLKDAMATWGDSNIDMAYAVSAKK